MDWEQRLEEFRAVVHEIPTMGGHDCVVGVSGGKDSTRQAVWIREKLDLNPLLICVTYPPLISTELGMRNLANLIELGFDVEFVQPAPETSRRFMRHSFLSHSNLLKATELALFSGVQRAALDHGISIIFWGENPALQVGDLGALGKNGWDGNNLRDMNTLGGGDLGWLEELGPSPEELEMYRFPARGELERQGVQILFLGWVLGDWSMSTNGLYGGLLGVDFREDHPEASGDPFGITAVDEDLTPVNQMLKYFKFGFGRATEYANEAIRRGEISRLAAIDLVQRLDGACSDETVGRFCEYVQLSETEFWRVARTAANRKLFTVEGNTRPAPRFQVGVGLR